MSHSNGIITAPVDVIGDIATVLGRNTGDVGQLCGDVNENGTRQYKINPYSKYKPVKYNTKGILPTYGYRSSQGNCGLNLTRLNYNQITKANVANATRWDIYTAPPTGISTEPYRVLDFDGYRHYAQCPLVNFSYPSNLYYNLDTLALMITARTGSHLSDTDITPYDLMCYFSNNTQAISADTTTWGYFGLILIGTGTEGDDAVICTFNRSSGAVQPTIDIIMDDVRSAASASTIFGRNKSVYLVPCLANIDTNKTWVNVLSNNSLQVLLWPTELVGGAYQSYTLAEYTPPVQPDYYVTLQYTANPWDFEPGTTPATQVVTVTIQKRTGTSACPSLYIEHERYTLGTGGQIASTAHPSDQWLADGGYDPVNPTTPIVTTLITGQKWQFTKTITMSFFLTNSVWGYQQLVRFSTPINVTTKLNGTSMITELTSETPGLYLGWYRN